MGSTTIHFNGSYSSSRKAVVETCKLGRTCHCCRGRIAKGEKYLRAGDGAYTNICKKCIEVYLKKMK